MIAALLGLLAAALGVCVGWALRRCDPTLARRASEARFRSMWDQAPEAVVVFDSALRIGFANAAVEPLLGQAPSGLIGQGVSSLVPLRLRDALALSIARAQRSGVRLDWHSAEGAGLHRDGREVSIEISLRQLELDGTPQFAAYFRDASARSRTEQVLRTSEERLQRALDASSLALWDFDVPSGEVYLSESWAQMMGLPREATRTTFAELADRVPQAERAGLLQALVTALKDGAQSYRVEHRVERSGGEPLWIRSEGQVVERSAAGRALRMLGTNRDITALKQGAAARLHLEAQLRELQKMEAIGTLAAGIAHDFNNILGAILGHLALAREDLGAAHPAARGLEQINKSAQRARSLVQQILAFGRHQPQTLVNRALAPLVEESIALLRATLPAGVSLHVELPPRPLHVLADATQVQQVLMNLCTNAWHALQGQAGKVDVGLEPVTLPSARCAAPTMVPEGAYAHLWVSDTGCGMDAATQARMFEPFFTTKPTGQGTGLGLSVVHGIVAAHGGAIWVDSTLGVGSTFHVVFPLVAAQDQAVASEWSDLPPLQTDGAGLHVLYVDDDEVMLLLVERLLSRRSYRVTCCQDPREALAALRANPGGFDLIVSDFNMPGLSGLDVAREAAQIRADLPVVISSGHLSDEQRSALRDCGVIYLIRKENTLEELGPIVDRALQCVAA
jgi:PAS domain S-box-containing protein